MAGKPEVKSPSVVKEIEMQVDTLYEDLSLSLLAVNNHSLAKVFPIRDGLREQGCLSPATIVKWDHKTACQRLLAAGYARGPYYGAILASRMQELALFATRGGLEQIRADIAAGKKKEAEEALLKVHGVGPAVLRNFWILQGADEAS